MGGILFQSFSRGNEQRLVVGIGINTTRQELQPGQASLDEIEIQKLLQNCIPSSMLL